jgi:hypothetical protein
MSRQSFQTVAASTGIVEFNESGFLLFFTFGGDKGVKKNEIQKRYKLKISLDFLKRISVVESDSFF